MTRSEFSPDLLACQLPATSKKQLLETLCKRLANHASLDERKVLDAVLEREKLGSTVIGDGIAIPHAMVDGASACVSLLATLEGPVDFDGVDVDLVMLVLGCEKDRTGHLAAMSAASKRLRLSSKSLRNALQEAELRNALEDLTAAA